MAVNPSIITRDLDKIADQTGNIYESIHIVGQRAKQISSTLKEELNNKLSEFASTVDNSKTRSKSKSPSFTRECLSQLLWQWKNLLKEKFTTGIQRKKERSNSQ
jgi:exonuclease VII large subunit